MDEPDDDRLLTSSAGRGGGPLSRVRALARRGQRRLVDALQRRLEDVGDQLVDRLREVLSSPEQIERLQTVLVNITNWSMQRGFRADPNAALLFEFVDWLEQRHSRRAVTSILMRSPVIADPEFLEALAHLAGALGPRGVEPDTHWQPERLDRFKRRAGDRLLEVLVELAALETDESAPVGSVSRQVEFFEEAPIPARFRRLAAMTRGEKLLDRDAPSSGGGLVQQLTERISSFRHTDTGLRRFVPGTGDETLYFLVFSTAFFFQSYLLRNLIEALPEVAEQLDRHPRDDDPIDVG